MNEETKWTKPACEVPAVTMKESENAYDFAFELPGIGKNDATLNVEGRTLTLKTDVKVPENDSAKSIICEFALKNYAASVDLPASADLTTLTASLEKGILLVHVAKKPETAPRKIAIA